MTRGRGWGAPGSPPGRGGGFRETLPPATCPGGVLRKGSQAIFRGHAVLAGEGLVLPQTPVHWGPGCPGGGGGLAAPQTTVH